MSGKKKTISKSKAKAKAWSEFSKYIRTRDAIATTGDTDSLICCTCGKLIPFKQSQAGHFIAGRTNALLFDEDIVHGQCYACNVCNHGEQLEYYYYMKRHYTEEQILEMRKLRYETVKYTPEDLIEIAEKYKVKYDELIRVSRLYGVYDEKTQRLLRPPRLLDNHTVFMM